MPELPGHPARWGVYPVLGHLWGMPIYAYETLVTTALLAGLALLWWDSRHQRGTGHLVEIAVAALLGGAVGAKLLEWALNPDLVRRAGWVAALLAGRTILGGLLGGTLGVWLVKRRLGITGRRGNLLAAPVALGLAIGRLGCFLHGCCYGTPSNLPWAVDFGDGVTRHPTQLYEVLFALAALVVLRAVRDRVATPGRLWSGFVMAYLGFRFVEEVVRAGPRGPLGLTLYQLAALAGLGCLLARELQSRRLSLATPTPGSMVP
jgi:phosphatidylglycerol---prolipoprotein diacylglyceryl transferase